MSRLFLKIEDIKLEIDSKGKKFNILSNYINLRSSIDLKLPLPRSGRYFVEYLKNVNFVGKTVLDIGTGYFGYLANHAFHFGARKVLALDINKDAISHAKKSYNALGGVDYRVSNIYSSVKKNEKFDIILSNPPQLPSDTGGDVHDVSGLDGMNAIKSILDGVSKNLCEKGELYLLVFDFLYKRTKIYCKNLNLDCEIMCQYKKMLRPNGETFRRAKYIEKIYTNYRFEKKDGIYHRIYILKIEKNENYHKNRSDCS